MKINKILGKRGRITIPYEIRLKMGFKYNDVVSFEEQDNNTVIIRREKICDHCKTQAGKAIKPAKPLKTVEKETSLLDIINTLDVHEKKVLLKYLARQLADVEES